MEAIIDRTQAIDVNFATARVYAAVIHQLEAEGKRIPLNDIWIAAMAMQHGCTLLARDAHFTRIEGLKLIAL
ncbi:MAG: PIN domain-containing protein [Opitutales bacterium]|nr:PIN domain-containing protein [Opitutales bacterium]